MSAHVDQTTQTLNPASFRILQAEGLIYRILDPKIRNPKSETPSSEQASVTIENVHSPAPAAPTIAPAASSWSLTVPPRPETDTWKLEPIT
jgi:hypothetical protein